MTNCMTLFQSSYRSSKYKWEPLFWILSIYISFTIWGLDTNFQMYYWLYFSTEENYSGISIVSVDHTWNPTIFNIRWYDFPTIWESKYYFDRLGIIQWDSGSVTIHYRIHLKIKSFFYAISCKMPFKITYIYSFV